MAGELNYQKAVEYFTLSAEQGFCEAQAILGKCYYAGNGVNQDYEQSVKWYKKAAEQGHIDSQNWLANYCNSDKNIEHDAIQSSVCCAKIDGESHIDSQEDSVPKIHFIWKHLSAKLEVINEANVKGSSLKRREEILQAGGVYYNWDMLNFFIDGSEDDWHDLGYFTNKYGLNDESLNIRNNAFLDKVDYFKFIFRCVVVTANPDLLDMIKFNEDFFIVEAMNFAEIHYENDVIVSTNYPTWADGVFRKIKTEYLKENSNDCIHYTSSDLKICGLEFAMKHSKVIGFHLINNTQITCSSLLYPYLYNFNSIMIYINMEYAKYKHGLVDLDSCNNSVEKIFWNYLLPTLLFLIEPTMSLEKVRTVKVALSKLILDIEYKTMYQLEFSVLHEIAHFRCNHAKGAKLHNVPDDYFNYLNDLFNSSEEIKDKMCSRNEYNDFYKNMDEDEFYFTKEIEADTFAFLTFLQSSFDDFDLVFYSLNNYFRLLILSEKLRNRLLHREVSIKEQILIARRESLQMYFNTVVAKKQYKVTFNKDFALDSWFFNRFEEVLTKIYSLNEIESFVREVNPFSQYLSENR